MIFKDKTVIKKLDVILKYIVQRERIFLDHMERMEKLMELDIYTVRETLRSVARNTDESLRFIADIKKTVRSRRKKAKR